MSEHKMHCLNLSPLRWGWLTIGFKVRTYGMSGGLYRQTEIKLPKWLTVFLARKILNTTFDSPWPRRKP